MSLKGIKSKFEKVVVELGMNQYPVVDEQGKSLKNFTLFDMIDNRLWLPRFVLKANEVSQYLFKGSCIDVVFKFHESCASGFLLENSTEVIKSNYDYPIFQANVSDSMLEKVIKHAVIESLYKTPSGLQLKKATGMYLINDGDEYIRPLDQEIALVVSLWHDRLEKMDKSYSLVMNKDNLPSMEP